MLRHTPIGSVGSHSSLFLSLFFQWKTLPYSSISTESVLLLPEFGSSMHIELVRLEWAKVVINYCLSCSQNEHSRSGVCLIYWSIDSHFQINCLITETIRESVKFSRFLIDRCSIRCFTHTIIGLSVIILQRKWRNWVKYGMRSKKWNTFISKIERFEPLNGFVLCKKWDGERDIWRDKKITPNDI